MGLVIDRLCSIYREVVFVHRKGPGAHTMFKTVADIGRYMICQRHITPHAPLLAHQTQFAVGSSRQLRRNGGCHTGLHGVICPVDTIYCRVAASGTSGKSSSWNESRTRIRRTCDAIDCSQSHAVCISAAVITPAWRSRRTSSGPHRRTTRCHCSRKLQVCGQAQIARPLTLPQRLPGVGKHMVCFIVEAFHFPAVVLPRLQFVELILAPHTAAVNTEIPCRSRVNRQVEVI